MADASVFEPFLTAGGRVSGASLETLRIAGDVLEAKKRTAAPKVIAIKESSGIDLIVKIWYSSHWFSSATFNPYSRRFRLNARQLQERGFSAPTIRGWGWIGSGRTCFVCYEALQGSSLRALKPDVDLVGAAGFVARLHDQGVDFRSLHMGNILQSGIGGYGLIDVTDCRFFRRPLPLKLRARRLGYFFSHKLDSQFMNQNDQWLKFLDAYCRAADSTTEIRHRLPEYVSPIRQMMLTAKVR